MSRQKIVVIAGPTASGKTALSVELAKRLDGEIICADSMQIYKELSISTAKPTAEEMGGIKHRLVDFVSVSEGFSVADYVKLAKEAICEVASEKKLPIVCGGTGLYISSLTENISFGESRPAPELREQLKALAAEKGGGYLLETLRSFDPETADRLHENNLNRIIRAIEIYRSTGVTMTEHIKNSRAEKSPYDALIFVLDYKNRQTLYDRIDKRVDDMMSRGLLDEAKRFLSAPGLLTAKQAIGCKEFLPYFNKEAELSECVENLKRSTRRYAKRQLTWFRRIKNAVALYPDEYGSFSELSDAAEKIIRDFLKEGD